MLRAGGIRAFRTMTVGVAIALTMVLGIAVAQAQTGYPPTTTSTTTTRPSTTTTTTTVASTTTSTTVASTSTTLPLCDRPSVDLGTLNQGESGTGRVGGFAPNSTTQLSLNGGNSFGTATVDASGCVTVTVTVTNAGTTALGLPMFAAQGLRLAAATPSTVTINGVSGLTAKIPGQQNAVSVSGTGPGGAFGARSVLFKVAARGAAGNALSRTGAMILRWTVIGLLLVALGTAVVLVSRRRTTTAG